MIFNPIFIIAKKEILDNIRNKWVIVTSILFAFLTLVFSYFGTMFSEGWQDFETTVGLMMSPVQFLIPIIGLLIGYAAIIGEIEHGSMSSLISLPTNRLEIILGKFIGLGCIIFIPVLLGFGIAGIIIGISLSDVNILSYLIFILATVLFGIVFMTIALFFSTIFKKRSTAIGGAVFLWIFFVVIIPTIITGITLASVGFEEMASGDFDFPDSYYTMNLLNPTSVYSNLVYLSMGNITTSIFGVSFPDYYSTGLMTLILIIWVTTFLIMAYLFFKRRDI
jgi:ABC-type transport system involved in multi-copper enzyme maturation permease subunit